VGSLPFGLQRVVGTGEVAEMSEEEEEAFLRERRENLSKLMPMTEDEFDDEIEELRFEWMHYFAANKQKNGRLDRIDKPRKAGVKRRIVLRNRNFFQSLRLFRPISLRYSQALEKIYLEGNYDIEDRTMKFNPAFWAHTEKIAGFSYEDWANETSGLKYDNWQTFALGDLVEGEVVTLNDRGAFVEIGDKSWAFLPLENCSLSPIAHPDEVLSIGDKITAEVIDLTAESKVDGEMVAHQKVLSLTKMQSQVAWDEIDAVLRVEEGTSNVFEVLVKQMRPWGAIVQTERGLEGFVPNAHLADKVGDSAIVGTKIDVELLRADRSKSDLRPSRPSDFALTFSYANAATKKIASSLQEGQVVTAVVKELTALTVGVDIMNCRCTIRKVDISGSPKNYDIADIFELNEEIKVYVISVLEKTGAIRLSTRALEFKKGALLTNKAEVFERAEKTAAKYLEQASAVKDKFESALSGALDAGAGTKKKSGGIDIESGLDDDDAIF